MKSRKAYARDYVMYKVVEASRFLETPRVTVVDAKALGDEVGHMQLIYHLRLELIPRWQKLN